MNNNPWYMKKEVIGGILLFFSSILAILWANSSFEPYYRIFLETHFSIQIGNISLDKSLLHWINDGLMGLFFFLIGMELKREFLSGELSDPRQIALPAIGAIGGIIVPAAIYYFFNRHDEIACKGWAIPTATDIAFALGVLALLGSKVPLGLKVFLTSLAIFDDISAIIIIALFYTQDISWIALGVAGVCLIIGFCFNRFNISIRSPYIILGVILWIALLKSGIHATLAGFLLAFFIPFAIPNNKAATASPLVAWEHDLQTWVIFLVLPVFALANSGVSFQLMTMDSVFHSVSLGIFLGLLLGKPIGIMLCCGTCIALGILNKPKEVNWLMFFGASMLCGIGFTMSIFIGSLAFETSTITLFDERIGILTGSFLSGLIGFVCIKMGLSQSKQSIS